MSSRTLRGLRVEQPDLPDYLRVAALRPPEVRFAVVDRFAVERVLAAGFRDAARRSCKASKPFRSAVPSFAAFAPGILDDLPDVVVEVARTIADVSAHLLAQGDQRLLRIVE